MASGYFLKVNYLPRVESEAESYVAAPLSKIASQSFLLRILFAQTRPLASHPPLRFRTVVLVAPYPIAAQFGACLFLLSPPLCPGRSKQDDQSRIRPSTPSLRCVRPQLALCSQCPSARHIPNR